MIGSAARSSLASRRHLAPACRLCFGAALKFRLAASFTAGDSGSWSESALPLRAGHEPHGDSPTRAEPRPGGPSGPSEPAAAGLNPKSQPLPRPIAFSKRRPSHAAGHPSSTAQAPPRGRGGRWRAARECRRPQAGRRTPGRPAGRQPRGSSSRPSAAHPCGSRL